MPSAQNADYSGIVTDNVVVKDGGAVLLRPILKSYGVRDWILVWYVMLKAPFPFHGGKSRWASMIWAKFGDPDVYSEPFAGSLGVLLNRPAKHIPRREIVTDTSGLLSNFWRSVKFDPQATAWWADNPVYHDDLFARHKWLLEWIQTNALRIRDDATFYDAQAAGWFAWGASCWIGASTFANGAVSVSVTVDGQPVDMQPHASTNAQGVKAIPHDYRPQVGRRLGGRGVVSQVGGVGDGERLQPWFLALAERMYGVLVLNRPWGIRSYADNVDGYRDLA